MSIWDGLRYLLFGPGVPRSPLLQSPPSAPSGTIQRAFRTGPADVLPSDESWGRSPETFSPEAYGEFIATSVAVHACATMRAEQLGGLPLRLWRTGARGKRTEVTSGQTFDLLRRPNPRWSTNRMIQMTSLGKDLWGAAYWMLERGRSGRLPPREAWWAKASNVHVLPDRVDYLAGFVYEAAGERLGFLPDEVIWFRNPNPIDQFAGLSVIAAARLSITTGHNAIRSNNAIFENGSQVAGIVSPADPAQPWEPGEADLIREALARRLKGVGNAHRLAVITQAMKLDKASLSPADAQFVELMRWSKGEVATAFKIAPELIGDHEHATYSNLDAAYKAFWTQSMRPLILNIQDELTHQLLPMFGEADEAEFDTSMVPELQEDRSEVVEQIAKLWGVGIPLNVLLREFMPNLLPASGRGYAWGETGYLPSKVVPAEMVGRMPEPGAPGADDADDGDDEPGQDADAMAALASRAAALLRAVTIDDTPAPVPGLALPVPAPMVAQVGVPVEAFDQATAALCRRIEASVLTRLREARTAVGTEPAGTGDETLSLVLALAAVADDPFSRPRWGKEAKRAFEGVLRTALAASDRAWTLHEDEAARWVEGNAQEMARRMVGVLHGDLTMALHEGIAAGEGIPALGERVRAGVAGAVAGGERAGVA